MITIHGDAYDENGNRMTKEMDLWRRDPVECIHELIGNPAFDGMLMYAPEQVFRDEYGNIRIFDEMWTGEWWWDLQVCDVLHLKYAEVDSFYLR